MDLTLEELATRVGCCPKHLGRLERGTIEPKAILLHDLARSLGVLVDALYDRAWSWERRKRFEPPISPKPASISSWYTPHPSCGEPDRRGEGREGEGETNGRGNGNVGRETERINVRR